jgi:hypothetical protein
MKNKRDGIKGISYQPCGHPYDGLNNHCVLHTSHTPTPWKLVADGIIGDGDLIAYNDYMTDADAKFIVRAVNSHEALLLAAKNLYYQYFARIQATAHVLDVSEGEGKACDAIQKAIAQAEEK